MKILALIGLLAIIAVIAAAAIFFGGFYSVAGTAEDSGPVKWALNYVRQASINPKLGMPVHLMPFLTTQNNWRGSRLFTISLRSGGSGRRPSENLAQFTPGAP